MVTSPLRQSMSSRFSAAASLARSASRKITVSSAKSRRPTARRRSHEASSAATCAGGTSRGSDAPDQPAALGTAQANSVATSPSRNR
jgi:hypothetical protein